MLEHWHQQLQRNERELKLHLQAVTAALPGDAIAPLRREALELLQRLSQHRPGPEEHHQLARLLRGWGDQAVLNFPGLARYHYETAWTVLGETLDRAKDPLELLPRLANLAKRQGLECGAIALGAPDPDLPPWFETSCYGLGCGDCQEQLHQQPWQCPQQQQLELSELAEGRIWIERDNPWNETYGVVATAADGQLQPDSYRCYPWSWPGCRHSGSVRRLAVAQLAWRLPQQPPAQRVAGPVLAVADLSAELYYHFQLELLPRLGLAWQQLSRQEPQLKVWHNGGDSARVREALALLGIPGERVLHAEAIPHLQAERLWLANWPSPFGAPGSWAVQWLRDLYGITDAPTRTGDQVLWLPRGSAPRRPLLEEECWIATLREDLASHGLTLRRADAHCSVRQQLQVISQARAVIAPHGGAMVNLFGATSQTPVLELVNPAYAPPYFATLMAGAALPHRIHAGMNTIEVISRLLYSGSLELPIDLGPMPKALPVLRDHLFALLSR